MVNQEPITAILQGSLAKHVLKDLIIRGLNTKRQSDINMFFFYLRWNEKKHKIGFGDENTEQESIVCN